MCLDPVTNDDCVSVCLAHSRNTHKPQLARKRTSQPSQEQKEEDQNVERSSVYRQARRLDDVSPLSHHL